MTSNHDRAAAASATADHTDGGAGHAGTDVPAGGSQTPRLVASWLVVGLPLAYGIYQTISRTLPLFGG
jgi:hypothetical protein